MIVRHEAPVDTDYTPSRLIREAEKRENIILFKVKGYEPLVVANLIPSRRILYQALGVKDDIEAYSRLLEAYNIEEESVDYGEFSNYFKPLEENWIRMLPALKFYKGDGGPYITSSIIIACLESICNASIHRMMRISERKYAVRVVPRHLHYMLKTMEAKGKGLPVAIVIGVHPLVELAAAMSPPYGVFELLVASKLLGGLKLCRTQLFSIPVPCGSSIVIEGVLGPERAKEGPFVDLLGLYDAVRLEPVLVVHRVYVNRKHRVFFRVILPGGLEHKLLMGFPREAQVYHSVARVVPSVKKVRLTMASGMWLHAVISIKKQHEGDAKNAGLAALAAHTSLKHVIVVDDDIDPDDPWQLEWAIATRFRADRDLVVINNVRGSTLDPYSPDGLTTKLIIDATAPLADKERFSRVE